MRRTLLQRCSIALAAAIFFAPALGQAGDFKVSSGAEFKEVKSELQAIQFLARATFGYTYDVDPTSHLDVKYLAERIRSRGHKTALSEWIDDQIDPVKTPITLHEPMALQLQVDDGWTDPYTRPSGAPSELDYRDYAWWQAALTAPDQLRQRVAFALFQIVVINDDADIFNSVAADQSGQPRYMGTVHYNDMLVQNAFDNYRKVLGDVAYHPVMGNFLTHLNNQKPSADGLTLPDENFAREILQLFSMSEFRTDIEGTLVKDRAGNLVQNYTNEDIKALARVFTGLQYANSNSVNLHDPMQIRSASRHDFNEKVLPTLRLTLPVRTQSAENGYAEINEAIDYIFAHPNVGPYIARILIQRLVMANPSKRYIRDVATVFNDNGQGVRGDLAAVVKAILCHQEALNSQTYARIKTDGSLTHLRVWTKGTERSKLVEPIIRYSQFIKMFNGQAVDSAKGIRIQHSGTLALDMNQLPYEAPSVFNYFRPDNQPPGFQNYPTSRRIPNGELYSPEAQLYTPVFANRFQSLMYRHLHNNVSSWNSLNFSAAFADEISLATSGMVVGDFSDLIERLDMLMCHGSLSEVTKSAINTALTNGHLAGNNSASELARLAIFGVFGTPECAIDK